MRTPRIWTLPAFPTRTADLLAAGVTTAMLATQLASGRLVRLRQGIYLAASAWPDDLAGQHMIRARAELVANPAGVISHQSAALIWGLPSPGFAAWAEQPVSTSFASGIPHSTRSGPVEHRTAHLPPEHLTSDPTGCRITTLARTAVDVARGRPLPDALGILDAAARKLCESYVAAPRRRDYSNPRLISAARSELAKVALQARAKPLLRVVEIVEPARESMAESLSAGHFELAGLPRPIFQHPLQTAIGVVFPDCYWPEFGLVGECDGAVKYTEAAAIVREKEREQALRDLGLPMVRWLAKEIMLRPAGVVDRVSRALDACS